MTALVCRIGVTRDGGEAPDPEVQRAAVAGLVDLVRPVLEAHGASVGKALGGRTVAIFGIPQVHEDDASRAVHAAAELRELGAAPRIEPASGSGALHVELRVGIATGEVLVEGSGPDQTMASADPVEVAERLCRAARPGEILLTQSSSRLAQHTARAQPTEILLLDDADSPLSAFRLVDVWRHADSGRRLSSPLVGRQEELGVLQQVLGRVRRERTCSLVTILGLPGVGKTKLLSAFTPTVGEDVTVLEGRCLSYGRDITFWPVAEIVKEMAGITDLDPPPTARAAIHALLAAQEDAAFLETQIAGVLGLADVAPAPEEIFWAIRRLLEDRARSGPLVVVFDDIHWADPTLLDLIEYVASTTRDVPLMLVCMARPELIENRPGWGGGRLDATNLSLQPLSDEETGRLLENLLGGAELAQEAHERIKAAAEGHPLFLEELLSMLIDDGLLQWSAGRWVPAGDLSDVPIPLTVQALLGARLDRLSGQERTVLERASVVGKDFSEQDLIELASENEDELASTLGSLVNKDIVVLERLSPQTGRAYRFRHILIRDAVYQAMSKEARARVHEAFGTAVERRAGGRIAEYEEILAYHFEMAHRYRSELGLPDDGDPSLAARAAKRLASAGRRAIIRYDMPAAISLLRRALTLLPAHDARRPEITWLLAVALFDAGQLSEAQETVEGGLEFAERMEDEPFGWRLRVEQADLQSWLAPGEHETQEQLDVASAAIEAFERLGDGSGLARAHRLLGDALARRGQQEEALEAYGLATRYARESGDERELTQRRSLALALGAFPLARSIEVIERHRAEEGHLAPSVMAQLAFLYAMAGRFEEAREVVGEALQRARDVGIGWEAASISMYYATLLLWADDPAAAEVVIRPAIESLQRVGEHGMMSTSVAILAETLYRQGKYDEAMLATLVSEEATAPDDVASQMMFRGTRAKVMAAQGMLEDAERLAREAVGFADQTDMIFLAGAVHVDLATVLEAAGRPREAAEQVKEALSVYERKGIPVLEAQARVALGRLQAAERSVTGRGMDP